MVVNRPQARPRLPTWLVNREGNSLLDHELKTRFRSLGLHTVCESARCPNRRECFTRGTATFMILGNACTRRCGFCAVETGRPESMTTLAHEPEFVADCVAGMGLKHVVITSVARDDLRDGGASHFVRTITALRRRCPGTKVEVLTPDFKGDRASIHAVLDAGPDIFNHNMETVERLSPKIRPQASYRRSLDVLREVSESSHGVICKSGFMLGLGETEPEVKSLLGDLRRAGAQMVTIGQYLQPTLKHSPVVEYIHPDRFASLRKFGESLGFLAVFSGPLVRSSYMADAVAGPILA
ncbi:MAG: lipoyl synthase [Acidobacteria bacterium]|nr:lipoyl synthase [Acidobacteriota bacterium]